MSTVLLAPGLELQVTGMPYGETPVLKIGHRRRRLIRRVLIRTGVLIGLFVAAASLFWHVGQPLWGNWPQVDATVTSQHQYVSKGTHCSLGLSYIAADQKLATHYSEFDPCGKSLAIGSVVKLGVNPADHTQIAVAGVADPIIADLVVTGAGSFPPLFWMSIFVAYSWRHYRTVTRLGSGPWHEVTGTAVASSIVKNRLHADIRSAEGLVFRINFGLRGITYFPAPGAGSTVTLRLAGDGGGGVMVGIKGLTGDNLGAIGPVSTPSDRAKQEAAESGS